MSDPLDTLEARERDGYEPECGCDPCAQSRETLALIAEIRALRAERDALAEQLSAARTLLSMSPLRCEYGECTAFATVFVEEHLVCDMHSRRYGPVAKRDLEAAPLIRALAARTPDAAPDTLAALAKGS